MESARAAVGKGRTGGVSLQPIFGRENHTFTLSVGSSVPAHSACEDKHLPEAPACGYLGA